MEAGTKGGVLLLASNVIEDHAIHTFGLGKGVAGLCGGAGGGVVQAYTTMAPACLMKTIEVTRQKGGPNTPSTLAVAADILRKEGITGMYRGVSAVALRQMTNWGTRFGVARLTEQVFQKGDSKTKLTKAQRLSASVVGGAAMWREWQIATNVSVCPTQRLFIPSGTFSCLMGLPCHRKVHADHFSSYPAY